MLNDTLQKELLELLNSISGESTFVAHGAEDFILPGLEIKGLGIIPFPLTPLVAKQIIEQAQQAPYGKGSETIVDTNVRNTWEIDASQIQLNGKHWDKTLNKIVSQLKEQLGINDKNVTPELYKLLLYESGSFFLKHKDSEKAKGMFGSLSIIFPSSYSGGQFVIEFDGKKETIDFSNELDSFNWIGFYADCDHEILPITKGYRLSIVYNLICKDQEKQLSPFKVSEASELALSFFQCKEFSHIEKPLGLILKHQYTPTNFSLGELKGGDYETANILLEVAKTLGWYANAGLLNHHVIGAPLDYDYYDRNFDVEDAVMDEVYDNSSSIANWCIKPSVGELFLEDLHIVNELNYDSEEPFEKSSEGYMGNYGPEVEYWYHNVIILLAPPQAFNNLMLETTINEKIEWIDYYLDPNHQDLDKAISIYQNIDWSNSFKHDTKTDALFLLWAMQPKSYLQDNLHQEKFLTSFKLASNSSIAGLLHQLDKETVIEVLTYCIKTGLIEAAEKCSAILAYMFSNETYASASIADHLESPLIKYFKDIISKYDTRSHGKHCKESRQEVIKNLIVISNVQALDIDDVEQQIASIINRKLIYDVLLPVINSVKPLVALTQRIKNIILQFLENITAQVPQTPVDAYRDFSALDKMDDIDEMLCDFCKNREAHTMQYRKAEHYRGIVINRINIYVLDIDHKTIKQGSPHTLVLTKNQNSFHRKLKEYEEDVSIVAMLKRM